MGNGGHLFWRSGERKVGMLLIWRVAKMDATAHIGMEDCGSIIYSTWKRLHHVLWAEIRKGKMN